MAALYKHPVTLHRLTLTQIHTHIVGVGDIAFHAAERIAHEPILKIRKLNFTKTHRTGVEDSCMSATKCFIALLPVSSA